MEESRRGVQWRDLAPLITPLAIALAAGWIQYSIGSSTVRAQYVKMATDILGVRQPKGSLSTEDAKLRFWALDILKTYAPVSVPEEVDQRLRSGDPLVPSGSSIVDPNLSISSSERMVVSSFINDWCLAWKGTNAFHSCVADSEAKCNRIRVADQQFVKEELICLQHASVVYCFAARSVASASGPAHASRSCFTDAESCEKHRIEFAKGIVREIASHCEPLKIETR
jgi:hypothetical protein